MTGRHKPHNSLYIIDDRGDLVDRYDKRFCAGDGSPNPQTGDLANYSPGNHFSVFSINGVRCGALICHDYRYPELYRQYKRRGVEVMFHFYHAGNISPERWQAMGDSGRFAFETRNRLVRAWEYWATEYTAEETDGAGALVRREYRVEMPVEGDVVRSTSTFTSPAWDRPQVSQGMLRSLDANALSAFLADAGLTIEEQFGDWTRHPLSDTSPEIITIARKGL